MSVASRLRRIALWSASPWLLACGPTESSTPKVVVRAAWPAPARDVGTACADVGDLRACWGGPLSKDGIALIARPTPPLRLSSLGWRCTFAGASRQCTDRGRDVGPFLCEKGICRQRHPRLPDDGEWECADLASIVVCRGGERPAGAPPGASDPGFLCGPRRGPTSASGERVCVDLSPDLPDGGPGYRCRFEQSDGLYRVCERDPSTHAATDRCDTRHPCVSGLACVASHCAPHAPVPARWVDQDCDKSTCRFGSCIEGAP